jgi:hypothetical protein
MSLLCKRNEMERELPAFVEVSSFTEQKTGSHLVQVNYKCRIEGCKGLTQAKVKVPKGPTNFKELGRKMAKQIAKSHSECVKAYAKEQLMTEHEPEPCAEPATPDNPAKRLRTLSHAYDSVEKERNQLRTDNTDLKTKVDAMNAELRIFRQADTKIQSRRDDKNNRDKEAGAWTAGDASLTSAMNHDKTGLSLGDECPRRCD